MIQAIFSAETPNTVIDTAAYVLAPDVFFLLIQDGTARLLDLNGCFYAVPAVGAQMLRAVLQQNATAAVQKVAAQYDIEARQVQTDLQTFLYELERQRLICHPESLRSRRWLHTTAPFLALAPAFRSIHWALHSLETRVWMLLTFARLSFRLLGWSRTIRAWQQYYGAVPPDDVLDFDSFTNPPPHDEPYVGLWRLGMDRTTINTAASCGVATLLTGLGADELLDVQPFYLTELLRQGRFHTAWIEACKWARADNCSPWKILYPFGIANLLPAWTHGGLGRALLPWAYGNWKDHNDWAVAPWITRSFARCYALRSRAIENSRRTYRLHQSTGLSFALAAIESRTGDVVRWSLAAPRGMVIAHPFLDTRLLRFGLGMQTRLKAEPGRMKPVLAEAMRDVLPENVRNRRRKGHFNEVYYLGLARNLHKLELMIQEAPIEELGIIDKEVLTRCLQEAALWGVGVRPLHRLNLTLSLIKWLCMQDEWQHTLPSPTAVIQVRQ